MAGPFADFLRPAGRLSKIVQTGAMPPADELLYQQHRKITFFGNLCEKIRCLEFAYVRLSELSGEIGEVQAQIDQVALTGPGLVNRSAVPVDLRRRERRLLTEGQTLTFYAFYELANTVILLRQIDVEPAGNSALQYAFRIRNVFLVHPHLEKAAAPNAGQFAWGGNIAVFSVVGGNARAMDYCMPPDLPQDFADFCTGREVNEAMVRSQTRVEQYSAEQVRRLDAYGVSEPSLWDAGQDLNALLMERALPLIRETFESAVQNFPYRPWPELYDFENP